MTTLLTQLIVFRFFFFSSRRRHTRFKCDWSSDVCSSDLVALVPARAIRIHREGNPARERPGKKTGRGLPLPFRSFPDILISCRIRRFYTWMFLLDSSFRYLNASLGCASSRMVPSSSERGGGLDKTLKRRAHFFHHASTGEPMTRKVIIL